LTLSDVSVILRLNNNSKGSIKMKKLVLALALLTTASVASAHGWERGPGYGYRGGYNHYENHYHGGGYNWVAPAIIGGVIGYELAQPRTVYVQPQPQVVYQTPYCTPWTETMDQYGTVTRTRTCTQ
jgi:hypothetical protein